MSSFVFFFSFLISLPLISSLSEVDGVESKGHETDNKEIHALGGNFNPSSVDCTTVSGGGGTPGAVATNSCPAGYQLVFCGIGSYGPGGSWNSKKVCHATADEGAFAWARCCKMAKKACRARTASAIGTVTATCAIGEVLTGCTGYSIGDIQSVYVGNNFNVDVVQPTTCTAVSDDSNAEVKASAVCCNEVSGRQDQYSLQCRAIASFGLFSDHIVCDSNEFLTGCSGTEVNGGTMEDWVVWGGGQCQTEGSGGTTVETWSQGICCHYETLPQSQSDKQLNLNESHQISSLNSLNAIQILSVMFFAVFATFGVIYYYNNRAEKYNEIQ